MTTNTEKSLYDRLVIRRKLSVRYEPIMHLWIGIEIDGRNGKASNEMWVGVTDEAAIESLIKKGVLKLNDNNILVEATA